MLIQGNCLVNKSNLSGEIDPVFQSAFDFKEIQTQNVIQGGSQIINVQHKLVLGVVIAVGWNSHEGKMIDTISMKQENPYYIQTEMLTIFAFSFFFFFFAQIIKYIYFYQKGIPFTKIGVAFHLLQVIEINFPLSLWIGL